MRQKQGTIPTRWMRSELKRVNNICLNMIEFFFDFNIIRWYGNVSRFLNHSCSPNLEKVTVFTDTQEVRLPRLILFYCH